MRSDNFERLEGGRRIRGPVRAEPPMVSIITVLFQAKAECLRLFNNILAFDHNIFEWIVIDGGSQDGTVELLRQWDDEIDYWLSEPDSGIYDAMNKGIAAARGEYILHLNEGDTLMSLPGETLAECLKEEVDVASFAVAEDEIFRPMTGFPLRLINTWHHQGTFYRRTPNLAYDTSYRVFADFDLNQRILKSRKKVRLFEEVVSHHQRDGISQAKLNDQEVQRSIRKNFGTPYFILGFLWPYLWPHYQTLRVVAKKVLIYLLSLVGKSWRRGV